MPKNAAITGCGAYSPPGAVTSRDLESLVDTSDQRVLPYRPNWARVAIYTLLHVGAIAAPLYCTLDAVIAGTVLYFVTGFGVTLGYHRLLTHRSYQTFRPIEMLLSTFGLLAFLGGPIDWTGKHRLHHSCSDEPGDLHSPRHGFWWSQLAWLLVDPSCEPSKFAKDLCKSPGLQAIERWGWILNGLFVVIIIAVGQAFFAAGLEWLLWAICFRAVFVIHVAGLVNTVAHKHGPRPFLTADNSRNVWWVALLTLGEGWHNNHHASPQTAAHGRSWTQVDPTYYVICFMEAVGLAWNVVHPSSHLDATALDRPASPKFKSEAEHPERRGKPFAAYVHTLVEQGGPREDQYAEFTGRVAAFQTDRGNGRLSAKEINTVLGAFASSFSVNTMQGFVVCKPHGHTGDFEVLDRIYTNWMSPSSALAAWDRYFHSQAAPKAVRNRKAYFHKLLDNLHSRPRSARVLNVGSGPGRCMLEWLRANLHAAVHFDCIEADPEAIEYARSLNASHLDRITFLNTNVLRFRPDHQYDLVWAAGLFDYFDDRVFVSVARRMYRAVTLAAS